MSSGLTAQVRLGLHAYRHLGPREATTTAVRHLTRLGRGRVRGLKLQRRPLRASTEEVSIALGGRSPLAALEAAGAALPSVSRWAERLSSMSGGQRAELLARADQLVAHRFDLLGSGPVELGAEIDWQRDFKSGRAWPLWHISRLPISYPDSSDIKVPWELSRFQHLPLLAAAHQVSRDERYLAELGSQLTSWIAANPVEFGANWACTMDVAIRAVNWLAALALCATDAARQPWLAPVLGSLLLHGRFIRGHLEYGSARGNHYLSDIVGLLVVSAPFTSSSEGIGWARWAARELGREMQHQVRADGCAHEASTSYHRLVAELFIIGRDAAAALAPTELDPRIGEGLDRMLAFVSDYTRPDGLAPQIGDADSGRVLPLGDYGASDQRSHLHLFRQAQRTYHPAIRSAAYRDGGFYLLRGGDLYCAVRCGDVGIYGRGCHAHNDLLAFELCHGRTPLVVDPGSYVYTADPTERNRFRSTAWHSTLQVDGAEQNELRADRLFAMEDRARGELLRWEMTGSGTTLVARHHGYESLAHPATHVRMLHLAADGQRLEILDEVASDAAHELLWSFPLAPCHVESSEGVIIAHFSEVTLEVRAETTLPSVEQGWTSPAYGVKTQAPVLRLRARSQPGRYRTAIVLTIHEGRGRPARGGGHTSSRPQ
jgi:uncharacterized heparinase superfamily protein